MKKILMIVVAIVVVAIAAWSGLWFAGRGQVADRLDLEVARAEAKGTKVTWEERSISGFPFAYDVDVRNVAVTHAESGALVRIPQVVSRVEASTIDEVKTRVIGDIAISLPISERNREADARLPKVVDLGISSDALNVSVSGVTGSDRSFALSADAMKLLVDQDDLPNRLEMSLTDVIGTFVAITGKQTSSLQAGSLTFNADGTDTGGQEAKVDVAIDALSLTSTADLSQTGNLNEILFGGTEGALELVYTTGAIRSTADATDPTGIGGGSFGYAGSSATGVLGITTGRLEFRGESRENRWTVDPKQSSSPVRGTLIAEAAQASYNLPTGPAETPQPGGLRFSVIGLDGDETFWNALDAKGALDRTPAEVLIDLEATAKVTGRLDQAGPVNPLPVQLSNISVNALNLKALGADLQATGDVEVLQPINLPLGELKIQLSKGNAVLASLTEAGLIDEGTRSIAAAMLQVYARPVGDDAHETDLTFGNDGITMNGLRVQ